MRFSYRWIGWIALGFLCLAGCKKKQRKSVTKQSKARPATRSVALGKGAVKDGRGKLVQTKHPAKRVIVAGTPLYSEVLIDLGAQDKLVAVVQSPGNPKSLRKLETIGRPWPLNVEKVLAAKPDLVLGTVEPYRRKLEQIGNVPVYSGGSGAGGISSLKQIYELIENVDKLVHHSTARSRRLLQTIKQQLKVVGRGVKPGKVTAAIIYVPKPQDARIYVTNKKSPAHELLVLAGGVNVFAELKGFGATVEALIKQNPEVIITDPKHVQHVLQHRALQSLRAVKNKRVVGILATRYTSSRLVGAFRLLVKALHPTTK